MNLTEGSAGLYRGCELHLDGTAGERNQVQECLARGIGNALWAQCPAQETGGPERVHQRGRVRGTPRVSRYQDQAAGMLAHVGTRGAIQTQKCTQMEATVAETSRQLELASIIRALGFAARKHRDQRRKDCAASPYINHPIALIEVLCNEAGITEPAVLCAALLHDTIEDTETTAEELRASFGDAIAGIVAEVTDDKGRSPAERKRSQVEHAAHASREARLVKLADKICNLRDVARNPPVGWELARRRAYFDWALEVVDQMRGTHAGLEALFDAAYRQRP